MTNNRVASSGLALLILLAFFADAQADGAFVVPAAPVDTSDEVRLTVPRMLVESAVALGIGTGWYWNNSSVNSKDKDLNWDWPSWRTKLFSVDAVRFDTNTFVLNGRAHTRAGSLYYLIGRANGLGVWGSTAINVADTMVWEYVIEYPELISLNDLVFNVGAGPAIAEPLLQLGRFFRRGRSTTINQALSFAFAPIESINRWMDGSPWKGGDDSDDRFGWSTEREHLFRIFLRGTDSAFSGTDTRAETTLGVDLDLRMQRRIGQPGIWSSMIQPGAWSRMAASLTHDGDLQTRGSLFSTQTSLFGYYQQDIAGDDPDQRFGHGVLFALGSGFLYRVRELANDKDRLAVLDLLGPQFEWSQYWGAWRLRYEFGAYGNFSLVDSHALGSEFPADSAPPLTSAIRARGYYFALGGTGSTRLVAEYRRLAVRLWARGNRFRSIDGRDRRPSPLDAGLENFSDSRWWFGGELAVRPWAGPLGLSAYVEHIRRHGAMATLSRSSEEISIGAQIFLDL